VRSPRAALLVRRLARAGVSFGLAGLALLIVGSISRNADAAGDNTRTLTMHHVHTGESITITYKRDGQYVPSALKKLDWFLRDWRRNEEVSMDPRLFDILWQAYRETGATQSIEIICGYRAPKTNHLLRTRSGGVAKFSQHILGKAIDFFIPGVPLAKLRAIGLKLQRGGIGFYPKSGSPFVHMDVGTVRHWPGISRQQLVKIFPEGRTVHIPRDGKPLPGYAEALAEIEQRGNVPNARSLQLARAAGAITAHEERVAEQVAQGRKETLVALVNSGRDNGKSKGEARAVAQATSPTLARLKPGAPLSLAPPVRTASTAPVSEARPSQESEGESQGMTLASLKSTPTTAPTASGKASETSGDLASDDLFAKRFRPVPVPTEAPSASSLKVASADLTTTGSTGDDALAYAADAPAPKPALRPTQQPMGALRARLPRLVSTAHAATAPQPLTLEAKAVLGAPMTIGGQHLSSPWMRAAVMTPSVARAMTVSQLRQSDPRLLRALLYKPVRAVAMTFTGDPQAGMTSDRFSGEAVVFVATVRFVPQQTASLR
jgi:uncharacterized protein YcbK (DUF882 family)